MISAAFLDIGASEIERLVSSGATEGRDLEFKRQIPGNSDAEVKEFLADVSSLANAQGGDLVFGIEDVNGVAVAVSSLGIDDSDAAILRLENIVRDGLEPRVSGIKTRWIAVGSNDVIVMRVPASFAPPHRVRFKNSGRFYTRNSRGKYEMDTYELRTAFTEGEAVPKRFRALHDVAVAASDGKDMPFSIDGGPKAIVSVTPSSFFREVRDLEIPPAEAVMFVKPSGSVDWVETLEGALVFSPPSEQGKTRAYALTHRTGRLDAAWTIGGVREFQNGDQLRVVWPSSFEEGVIDMATAIAVRLARFGVEGPWVVSTTVSGVQGFQIVPGQHYASKPAFRNSATLPELVVEQLTAEALAPIFKSFWLLFGERRAAGGSDR